MTLWNTFADIHMNLAVSIDIVIHSMIDQLLPRFMINLLILAVCPCPGGNNQADEVQTDCWLIAS